MSKRIRYECDGHRCRASVAWARWEDGARKGWTTEDSWDDGSITLHYCPKCSTRAARTRRPKV